MMQGRRGQEERDAHGQSLMKHGRLWQAYRQLVFCGSRLTAGESNDEAEIQATSASRIFRFERRLTQR